MQQKPEAKKIAILGLGLIGKERVQAIDILVQRKLPITLSALHDPGHNDIHIIAKKTNALACTSIEEIIAHSPDLTIIATPHDTAAVLAKKLLAAGLNVLIEKPLGRSHAEAQTILQARAKNAQLFVGHNYRFYPGIVELFRDIENGNFGKPIGLSITAGHGGNPEDKNSWKLNLERCGGGALIDPGIHLIDLCRLIGGKLEFIGGQSWHGFWNTGIEEECKIMLRSQNIPMIDLNVSIVRWRSTFRLEFFGTDGYGIVEGKGRSYGPQQYRKGRRWGWKSGTSQIESEDMVLTSPCIESFADELESLLFAQSDDSIKHICTAAEGLENMKLLDEWRQALKLKSVLEQAH